MGLDSTLIPSLEPQPLELAHALPAAYYAGGEAAAFDRAAVFSRSWQLASPASALARPGDHVVTEIAGVPLLLVRDEEETLRAFHNVCRHRAGPLATACGSGARVLRCRYHGWTYGLDGVLRSAPEMQDATGFEAASIRLVPARVAAWNGLVFVALGEAPPLDQLLGGIDERVGAPGLGQYRHARHVAYEIACNWKVYVDNFLEGYHLPHVHPALNRMLDYRRYETTLARWHSLQSSPIEQADGPYAGGEALYYFVFPNTMLNVLPGRLQTNRVVPLGADRCRVDFDYYYPDAPEARGLEQSDLSFSDEIQQEDVAICEAVQRGLASGSYHAGRLNPRRESGVHHFHELLRAAYRAQLAAR